MVLPREVSLDGTNLRALGFHSPHDGLIIPCGDVFSGTASFARKTSVATSGQYGGFLVSNALCLRCHGEPGPDISAEDLALIQRLYPQDKATGFKLGQLRGAWRIDFPLAKLAVAPETQSQ